MHVMTSYVHARTPAEHVSAVKAAAQIVSQQMPGVRVTVDDWGRYSNFSVIVDAPLKAPTRLRKLQDVSVLRTVKRLLQTNIEAQVSGSRVRFRPYPHASYSERYKTYHLDLDFHAYDALSNQFFEA